jgi:hypothetical protein
VNDAGNVLADLVRGLLEAGCQPVEPTHANTPTNLSSFRPVIRAMPVSPRFDPAMAIGANASV